MRRVLFLLGVLVPCAAVIGILLDRGWAPFGSSPTVAERTPGDAREKSSSRPVLVSIGEGSGESLFVARSGQTRIEGKETEYTRSYLFAGSWTHGGPGVVLAQGPIVAFNEPPRNRYELSRLLDVDAAAEGPAAAGRKLAEAFGSHTGLRSDRATIHGSADMTAWSRVDLEGHVEGVFVDPEVPGDRVHVSAETMTLAFDEGRIVSLRTEGPFRVTRPGKGDLSLEGRGLELLVDERTATLLHDVRLELLAPGSDGTASPLVFATKGPVNVALRAPAEGGPERMSLAGCRISTDGGGTFSQGGLHAAATAAIGTFDDAGRVESIELAGDVVVTAREGTIRGDRLIAKPHEVDEFLRIEGRPVVARPDPRALPLASRFGADVALSTEGVVVVSAPKPASDGSTERSISVGPEVTIRGSAAHVRARSIHVLVPAGPRPSSRAFRVSLEEVRGEDQEVRLIAASLSVERGSDFATADDVITFPSTYDITYRPARAPRPTREAARDSATQLPVVDAGAIRIRGPGELTINRPLSGVRPVTAVARQPFHVQALDPKTGKSTAHLEADAGSATFAEIAPPERLGAPPRRELAALTAEGRVRAEIPDRAIARGDLLTYDARTRHAVLVGRGTDDPARIERTTAGGNERLAAGRIRFERDLLRLTATQSARADVGLAPLPWPGAPPSSEPVPSVLQAQRLVVTLDAERFARGEIAPAEVVAEIAVTLEQPDRRLSAELASLDLVSRSGFGRGSPLRYDVRRHSEDGPVSESLACPTIVLDGRRVLIEGPAEARLHARPLLPGGIRSAASATKPAAPEPHVPAVVRCRGLVLLADDFIRADGRTEIEQGMPDTPGIKAAADSATIFLVPDPADPKAAPDWGLAVLRGNATLRSSDLEAASDVMKLNRVTKHATLLNEREEKLSVILMGAVQGAEVHNGVSRLDIDFTDPHNPAVTTFDHDVLLTDTRSRPR